MSAKKRRDKMKNRQRRERNKSEEWVPFEIVKKTTREQAIKIIEDSKAIDAMESRKGEKLSEEKRAEILERSIDELIDCTTYLNNLYQVARYDPKGTIADGVGIIHLSIKRLDKQPITNWNHLQRIKNEIVGPEHEAAELFPAESRLVNLANQYHLWVLSEPFPACQFPFGFNEGRQVQDQIEGSAAIQNLEKT